ncbi:uncharacterized protein [Palaemon carinicauda]|uniref:uncharacterized protein n=1 Tax=Palaemon carinicauda TaxID=392227 RepID=UPI0035B62717
MSRSFVVGIRIFLITLLLVTCVYELGDFKLAKNGCDAEQRLKGPFEMDSQQVVKTIRLNHLTAPSSLPLNLTRQNDIRYSNNQYEYGWKFFHFYSQQFFSEHRHGFFIEAGALDGEFLSNTLWLEQHLGWKGLLIEADPINFKYLVWKRRKAWLSNTCISEKEYPKEAVFEMLQERSETFAVPWLYRANSRRTDTFFIKVEGDFLDFSAVSYSIVQCFPLASYLLALNVSSVDYLSLDVQGNEWDIIKNIPWDRISIRVMAVEHYHHNAKTLREGKGLDEEFVDYMKNINYTLVDHDDDANYIFVLKDDVIATRTITSYKDRNTMVNNSLIEVENYSRKI